MMDSMTAVGDPAGHVWGNRHWCRAGRWDQKGAGSGDLGRELGAATPVRAADGPPFLLGVEVDGSTHGSGGRVTAEVVARGGERNQRRGGRDGHPVAGTVGGWRRLRDAPRGAAAQPIDGGMCGSKSLDRSVVAAVTAGRGMGMRHLTQEREAVESRNRRVVKGWSLLTRAKSKAGEVEDEEGARVGSWIWKISERERARQPGRGKDRGHHRFTRVRPLCVCVTSTGGRHAMAGPRGWPRAILREWFISVPIATRERTCHGRPSWLPTALVLPGSAAGLGRQPPRIGCERVQNAAAWIFDLVVPRPIPVAAQSPGRQIYGCLDWWGFT